VTDHCHSLAQPLLLSHASTALSHPLLLLGGEPGCVPTLERPHRSVVRHLLAPCKPKADQTYLSQPEALSTFFILSSQGSILLWKGQESVDGLSFPSLSIHSLLYLLVMCLFHLLFLTSAKVSFTDPYICLRYVLHIFHLLTSLTCRCLPHIPSPRKG